MNPDDLDNPLSPATGPTRREVLAWSSAAAVGWLATPALVSAALSETAASAVEPMSVGYVLGSDRLSSFTGISWQNAGRPEDGMLEVVPAVVVEAEEREYALARVRVAGLYPHPEALGSLGLALTVLMPADGGTAPFYPWGVRSGTVRQVSPPIGFDVPLLADGGLELLLEVKDASPRLARATRPRVGALRTYGARFTSQGEKGVPRLRRGIYLLGTQWGMWEAPTLLPPADKPPRLDRVSVVLAVEPILDPFDP